MSRDSKKEEWWYRNYGWPVTIVTLFQLAVGTLVSYVAFNSYDLGYGLSFVAGSVVGVVIGIGYNVLARARKWERLLWIDVILLGISWYP